MNQFGVGRIFAVSVNKRSHYASLKKNKRLENYVEKTF